MIRLRVNAYCLLLTAYSTPLPSIPLRRRLDAAEEHVSGDIQSRAVVAPIAVRRSLARVDPAQVRSIRRENVHAAGAGREQVAIAIGLHAVGQTGLHL